jgi:hypothetical protein
MSTADFRPPTAPGRSTLAETGPEKRGTGAAAQIVSQRSTRSGSAAPSDRGNSPAPDHLSLQSFPPADVQAASYPECFDVPKLPCRCAASNCSIIPAGKSSGEDA